MTALHKPLKRQIGDLGLRGGDAGEYVVTLYPGGLLGFRRARSRHEVQVGLGACYRLACELAARQTIGGRRAARRRAR